MRIGIDVRYLSHGLMGGVHSYVGNLVPALIDLASVGHRVYLYADGKAPLEIGSSAPHVIVRALPWRAPVYSIYNDLFMRRWMAADKLDVVHFPANLGFGPGDVPLVLTLHDAINILPLREILRGHRKSPKVMAMMTYLHIMTTASLRRASLVITDSCYARMEIVRAVRAAPRRVVPIHLGLAPDLRRIDDQAVLGEVRQRLDLAGRFLLADALKNPGALLRAWRSLPAGVRGGRSLVFYSRVPDPPQLGPDATARDGVRLLVRPSRSDLIALYSMAEAFVFPSWIEGFGLPILEAMACGAPVIASDRGAIPEVAGGAALLCDADNDEDLARLITRVLGDRREAERLQKLGFARAAQFSWTTAAALTLDSYSRAIALSRPGSAAAVCAHS